jgi:hypothetical protein
MAADSILCNKPCALQNADKSYSEGTLYVFKSRIRFVARGGAAQKLEIAVEDIKGDLHLSWSSMVPAGHVSAADSHKLAVVTRPACQKQQRPACKKQQKVP